VTHHPVELSPDTSPAPSDRAVLWTPWPGFQTKALQCGANEALFGGAAGPGKTDVLIACAARYAQHPRARVLFLRTSYTDLQDVRDRMALLYPALGATWEAVEKRWRFPSGAAVEMGYGETVAEVSRYVGREYSAILFDELGLVPKEEVWTWLFTRVRSTDPTVPLRMRASANPGGPGHAWLKARFVTATNKGATVHVTPMPEPDGTVREWTRAYVPGTAKDNPSLPASYWAALNTLPHALRAALAEGDWDAGLGLFYPEVQGDLGTAMVIPPPEKLPPDWWDYWGGYDWGHRHPAVFVACARDGNSHVHVMDTLYLHKQQDHEQAAQIQGLANSSPPVRRAVDAVFAGHDAFAKQQAHSARPTTVADVFERYGITLAHANIDRAAGSRVLRRLLGACKIWFWDTPGNRRLLAELQALVPDETRPETPRKVDANADTGRGGDDGPDALRYALATPEFIVNAPLDSAQMGNDQTMWDPERQPLDDTDTGIHDQYPPEF